MEMSALTDFISKVLNVSLYSCFFYVLGNTACNSGLQFCIRKNMEPLSCAAFLFNYFISECNFLDIQSGFKYKNILHLICTEEKLYSNSAVCRFCVILGQCGHAGGPEAFFSVCAVIPLVLRT